MIKAVWDLKSSYESCKDQDVFDTQLAEFLLSGGQSVSSQEKVMKKYKVDSLEQLAQKQKEALALLPELEKLYFEIELPLVGVLWGMEKSGVMLDTSALTKIGEEIEGEISELEKELKAKMVDEINLNSSVQVGNYLAEEEGVPLARTKTGKYATGESEISKYSGQFPIILKILKYRELSKLRSTYIESLISKADEKSRVHTTYNQVYVSTGRLSSSDPNLQNIPTSSEYGKKIKSTFVASPGKTLVSFDYSQQELRILAHLSREDRLIEAFSSGLDVHRTTASQIFSVTYDEVSPQQRAVGKTINFGIVYGMGSFGLSESLSIPVEDAEEFIKKFNQTYPKISEFYDMYLKKGSQDRYVTTLLGRRRDVFAYPGQKFIDRATRRVLINYPIQGTAAELMKKAMVQIQKDVIDKDPSVQMLLAVHDDLIFEMEDEKVKMERTINQIREIMCNVYPLVVPVEVDVKVGKSWGEMKKWK